MEKKLDSSANEVFVAGIGIITSIGNDLDTCRQHLTSGQSGLSAFDNIDQIEGIGDIVTGQIKSSTAQLAKVLGNLPNTYTRTDLLAIYAFQEAIKDAGLSEQDLTSKRTAFLSACTVGGMSKSRNLYHDSIANSNPTEYLNSYSASVHLHKIVIEHGITGPTSVINTACSSSANAILLGGELIRNGQVDLAIVGGVDALSEFTVRGFNSLGIMSDVLCQPFDQNRKGLNLGEGAAFLVLSKQKPSIEKHGQLLGWANVNDSFHNSSLNEDGSGILRCLTAALDCAQLSSKDITSINAHGTATPNNDLAEITALAQLFSDHPVDFYSTKSFTGHTLGAAGAIEAVFSLLALNYEEVYPSLHISTPLTKAHLTPNLEYKKARQKAIMSNSFGFNGNCTTLIFGQ